MQLKNIAVLGASVAIAAVGIGIGAGGSAYADSLLGSAGIKDNSVRSKDVKDGTLGLNDMRPGAVNRLKGESGMAGAFYATAFYNEGNTNEGAVASVACDADPAKTDYVAIAGGVQTLALDDTPLDNNTPVSSSFPGRMDWATMSPKVDRLDGWIVQFGGNAGATADKAPGKVKVWALCVPGADIPTKQTFIQN